MFGTPRTPWIGELDLGRKQIECYLLLEVARDKDSGTKEESKEGVGRGFDRRTSEGDGKGENGNQEGKDKD